MVRLNFFERSVGWKGQRRSTDHSNAAPIPPEEVFVPRSNGRLFAEDTGVDFYSADVTHEFFVELECSEPTEYNNLL